MNRFFKNSLSFSGLFLLCFTSFVMAQSDGFSDNFEDGSLDTTWEGSSRTLWNVVADNIYSLNEENGILEIDYTRNSETTGIFTLTLPEPIDASENPRIKISVRSPISFTLDVHPVYIIRASISGQIVQEIPGDFEWHTYVLTIDDEYYETDTIKRLNFYFDREYDGNNNTTIFFDNLSIAGQIISVTDLEANTADDTSIQLNWNSTDTDGTGSYKVYRSTEQGFTANSQSLIAEIDSSSFLDGSLQVNTPYYYRILPVDTTGEDQAISAEIRQETYTEGVLPKVTVDDISSDEFKKYEKVELMVSLEDVVFDNPYNPEDLDLRARFISPSNDTTEYFGFYDNYLNRDQWKVRFSPDEIGTWTYEVYAIDVAGTSEAATGTFSAIDSEHPGYLQISETNPDYLEYSNGDFVYPMAVYYPWNVTESRLNRLVDYGVEFFGYWNSTYDNAGNGGGNVLLESMDSGLGRYDQRKSGRIDQLIEWAEERDMKMMYAIWAHPFVRSGAPGWEPLDWLPDNPYQDIIDAEEFFTDSLAWSYQKKNFRYVVARWGYSRSLAIWEMMNEIHGTTGYVANAQGARDWTDKVHELLKELDPHDRPTTSSYGGAEAWNVYNVKADMPNFHYYEGQGYSRPYNDDVRDGLHNIDVIFNALKATPNRPAFLGEAGYTTMFSDVGSDDYTTEFHNIFWAGLTKGIASTPFWWDFTTQSIFTDERMEQYQILRDFAQPLNLSKINVDPTELMVRGSEAFAMEADTMGFGWFWTYEYDSVSGLKAKLHGLNDHSYSISWYNTWTGETVQTKNTVSAGDVLEVTAPEMETNYKDIAFKVTQIDNGTESTKLGLNVKELSLFANSSDSARTVIAYIADGDNRLVPDSDVEITFTLNGPGSLNTNTVSTTNGIAVVRYTPDPNSEEEISITAEAAGLTSATLIQNLATSNENHEFNIPATFSLHQNYPNPFNPNTIISYELKKSGPVQLEVFDVTGRKISTLVNKRQNAGTHQTSFSASHLSSGVYFYTLKAGDFEQTRQMMLVK